MHGRVTGVSRNPLGDELSADAATGATTIYVDDGTDFDEDGGRVLLNGVLYAYSSMDYIGDAADEGDPALLMLATPLLADVAEGDRVDVWDDAVGEVAVEYVATIVPDSAVPGDPLEAEVDHRLVPLLAEGIRAKGSESVELDRDGDDLRVKTILGKTPEMVDTIITGGVHRTAEEGQRMEMFQDDEGGRVNAYFSVEGSTPGFLNPVVEDDLAWLGAVGWRMNSGTCPDWPEAARMRLVSGYPSFDGMPHLELIGTALVVGGYLNVGDLALLNGGLSVTGGATINGGLTASGPVELNTLDGTGGLSYVMCGNDGVLSRGDSASSLEARLDAIEARLTAGGL